jgi:hypothetical protein
LTALHEFFTVRNTHFSDVSKALVSDFFVYSPCGLRLVIAELAMCFPAIDAINFRLLWKTSTPEGAGAFIMGAM